VDWTGFFVCGGFLLLALFLALPIAAFAKFAALTRELAALRARLEFVERELRRRPAPQSPPAPAPTPEPSPASLAPSAAHLAPSPPPHAPPAPAPLPPEPTPATQRPQLADFIQHLQTKPPPVEKTATTPPAQPNPPATSQPSTYERYFGTKLPVIVGSIALAMAAIFLVKFMIDRNYFNQLVRVLGAAAAGLLLLGLGQWRRRRESFLAQGFSAAGIVAEFAAIFAATTLYHYLPPLAGFALLAAVTALTILLALQRPGGGPLIAALGLIGGFITPLLIRTEHPNVQNLFAYLLLLHVGLVTVTRFRGWTFLAALSTLASAAWMIFWLLFMPWDPSDGLILGLFMLASVAATFFITLGTPPGPGAPRTLPLTWFSGCTGLVLACFLLGRSNFSNLEWGYFAVLLAAAFLLARLRVRYEGLAWVASLLVLGMLSGWGFAQRLQSASTHEILPSEWQRLRAWMILFGLASVAAAYGCMWGSAAPARWSFLTSLLGVSYVVAAYLALGIHPRPADWGWLPLAAAALLFLLTTPVYIRRKRLGMDTVAILSHTILALLILAPFLAFTDGTLTACWALLLPLTLLTMWQLRLHELVAGLAVLFGILVLRALLIPGITDPAAAPGLLFWNPLVWTYGSIALAMILSALLVAALAKSPAATYLVGTPLQPDWIRLLSALFQVSAAVASFLLITGLIRWYFHDGRLTDPALPYAESGTYTAAWLALATLLFITFPHIRPLRITALLFASIAFAFVLFVPASAANPLFLHQSVGPLPLLNLLLYVLGLPAAAAAAFSLFLQKPSRQPHERHTGKALAVVSLWLTFLLLSLEIRQFFHGPFLDLPPTTTQEMTAYSLAWALLGASLLVAGIARQSALLRWASLALMLVTAVKVFLFDMAGLKDLLRVLSFAGLGFTLMALAFLYQRFIFKPRPTPPPQTPADPLPTSP
jgi:uncharacterized membrane protein